MGRRIVEIRIVGQPLLHRLGFFNWHYDSVTQCFTRYYTRVAGLNNIPQCVFHSCIGNALRFKRSVLLLNLGKRRQCLGSLCQVIYTGLHLF